MTLTQFGPEQYPRANEGERILKRFSWGPMLVNMVYDRSPDRMTQKVALMPAEEGLHLTAAPAPGQSLPRPKVLVPAIVRT